MYKPLLLLLLLVPPALPAAEALGNSSLSGSYAPGTTPCPPATAGDKDDNPPACTRGAATDPVAAQAVRDAEQQSASPGPGPATTPPPPATLPAPPVTPLQQEIIRDFESLQRPGGGQ